MFPDTKRGQTSPEPETKFTIAAPLSSRAVFWRAQYLAESPFLRHLPFLFWLMDILRPSVSIEIGTRDGVAYFGLCQAVQRLNQPAFCHSICDPRIDRTALDAYNASHFEDISDITQGDISEELLAHAPKVIDLALVDVGGVVGARRKITEQLHARLSDRGVILLYNVPQGIDLHDPKAFIPDIGPNARTIVLGRSNPLVVLVMGDATAAPALAALSKMPTGGANANAVFYVFDRLGRLQELEHQDQDKPRIAALKTAQADHRNEVDRLRADLTQAKAAADTARTDAAGLQAERKARFNETAALTEKLEAQAALMTQQQADHRNEVDRLRADLTQAKAAADTARTDTAGLQAERKARFNETAALTEKLEAQAALMTQQQAALDKLAGDLAETHAALDQANRKAGFDNAYRKVQLRLREIQIEKLNARDKTYKQEKQALNASVYFDAAWYLESYPDVAAARMDPAEHFVRTGLYEGRNPAPGIDTISYYILNPDALANKVNLVLHMENTRD
jgi:predicted  nucleic acid-binding Zn-ribbon protein